MKLTQVLALAVVAAGLATTALAAPTSLPANVYHQPQPGELASPAITAKFHDDLKAAGAGLPAKSPDNAGVSAFDHTLNFSAVEGGAQPQATSTQDVGTEAVTPQTVSACTAAGRVEYYDKDGSLHIYDVSCVGRNPPKPTSIDITWWEASLASYNTTPRQVKNEHVDCTWRNNWCRGMDHWFDSHTVSRTSAIFPTIHLVDVNGNSHDDQWSPWYYNDNGYPYPMFSDTRWGGGRLIPFRIPNLGWGVCEDNGQSGACDRPSWFRTVLQNWYTRVGWHYDNSWEAHHIAPLALGGGNNHPDENGVLIASNLHDVYTYKFWPAFRPNRW